MSRNIFITGTGTDVGKTYVTGLIVKKLKESGADAAYYKAAMSGNERRADSSLIPGDALQVKTMSGIRQPLEEMCPYIYETAVSPHLASRLEGNPVRMETVLKKFHEVCEKYEYVTVEGSGGILCPLCFCIYRNWNCKYHRQTHQKSRKSCNHFSLKFCDHVLFLPCFFS